MATGAQTWSTSAASNNSADSSVNWAEGMSPAAVNNSARAEMASAAMHIGDNSGTIATSGTTLAYTVTSKQVSTSLVDGYTIMARMHATNDAAATLNVDGAGAKAIHLYAGTAVAGGEFLIGSLQRFTYTASSTSWIANNYRPASVSSLLAADGTVGAPSHSFTNDTDCGLYRIGANDIGFAIGGGKVTEFTTATVTVTGALTASGKVTASSSMEVANATLLSSALTVAGAATLSSSLTVANAALIGGALTVTGATQTSSLATTNAISVGGTATIGGAITATAGQIAFPATQNPSAGANTLDDYVEGTFTPAIKFGGASVGLTYTTQSGTYLKIGKIVFVTIVLTVNSNGSSSGSATITALPFTSGAISSFSACLSNSAGSGNIVAAGNISDTTMNLYSGLEAASFTALTEGDIIDGTSLIISGSYIASA